MHFSSDFQNCILRTPFIQSSFPECLFFSFLFFFHPNCATAFYPSLLYLLVEILLSGNWKVWVFNVSNERRNISYGVKWNTCSPTFSSKRWPQTWCADFCFPLITAWDAGTKIFVIGEALIFLSNDKVSWSFPILVYFSAHLGRLPPVTDICHLMCKLWDLLFALQSFGFPFAMVISKMISLMTTSSVNIDWERDGSRTITF